LAEEGLMAKHGRRLIPLVAGLAVLGLVATACGGGGGGEEQGTGGGGETVNVELKDFSIVPEVSSVGAGPVTFAATNEGPSEHELVVLASDLAPDALPVEGGKVDEEGSGIEMVGEIEEFEAGEEGSATFDLAAGNYVLICNIPGHYEAGMVVAFEVT